MFGARWELKGRSKIEAERVFLQGDAEMTPVMADTEYSLFAQNDVAASLINAIYANGAEFVKPEELVEGSLARPTRRAAVCVALCPTL